MVQAIRGLRPTGQTPLRDGPARWATMDDRHLAAMLSDAALARGETIQQIEADALHQAKRVGLFGVPTWLLNKISRACSFDLDARPHTLKDGEAPIGTPPKHAKLANQTERMALLCRLLWRAEEKELKAFKDGSRACSLLEAWMKKARKTERPLKAGLRVLKEEYAKLGKIECMCSVCVRIRTGFTAAERKLRDADAVFDEISIAIDEGKYAAEFLALPRPPAPAPRPPPPPTQTATRPAPARTPLSRTPSPAHRPPPSEANPSPPPNPAMGAQRGPLSNRALILASLLSVRARLQDCSRLSDEFGALSKLEGYWEAQLEMADRKAEARKARGRRQS